MVTSGSWEIIYIKLHRKQFHFVMKSSFSRQHPFKPAPHFHYVTFMAQKVPPTPHFHFREWSDFLLCYICRAAFSNNLTENTVIGMKYNNNKLAHRLQ